MPEADADFTPDVFYDTYLKMELAIPRYVDGPDFAEVKKRLTDKDGLPIGRDHNNPILDTRMYEEEYKDGHKSSLASNSIAEKCFAQVGGEVNQQVIFQDIVYHRYVGAEVKEQDTFIMTHTGTKPRRETTEGVEVLDQWKDGSTAWVNLKDMKNSYPVQMV